MKTRLVESLIERFPENEFTYTDIKKAYHYLTNTREYDSVRDRGGCICQNLDGDRGYLRKSGIEKVRKSQDTH